MATDLAESIGRVQQYSEWTDEQIGGLGDVQEFLNDAERKVAAALGSGNETVAMFASAGNQVETVIGLVQNAKVELDILAEQLAAIQ